MLNNGKISSLQFGSLLTFPLFSIFVSISFNNLIMISGIDSYISIFIAGFIGLILILQFNYIFSYKEELSLIEKNRFLFGTFIGNLFNIILVIIAFVICSCLIFSISDFIITNFLSETPIYFLLFFMGIAIIYGVSKGIEVIIRSSLIFFIIIFLFNIVSNISIISNFSFYNIKPFLEYGLYKPIYGSFSFIINTISPILFLLIIPKNDITDKDKVYKYLFVFYLIGIIMLFIICFLTSGVIGINLLKFFLHPEYIMLKKISIFGFVDRIENILYLKWFFSSYITVILLVYFISKSINKDKKNVIISSIITILLLFVSQIIFSKIISFRWFITNIYFYFSLILIFILELIFIKTIKNNRKVFKK